MATFVRAAAGQEATSQLINQIIDAWTGVANKGVPLNLVVNDPVHYAIDVRNLDATAGKIMRLRCPTGTDLLTVDKDSILVGATLEVAPGVLVDGIALATHAHTGGTDGATISHAHLTGLEGDDHTQYYNAMRHTKAIHDALAIDADTVDGQHASDFAPWADFKQSNSVCSNIPWALPAGGVWSDISGMTLSLTLGKTCVVIGQITANLAALSGDYVGTVNLRAVIGGVTLETWTEGLSEKAMILNAHWYSSGLTGTVSATVQFMRSQTGAARNMTDRRFTLIVIPVA